MKIMIFAAMLALTLPAVAHEGAHGPVQKMAPHGGTLKDGKTLMAELVQMEAGLKIYLLSHDGKPVASKDVKIDTKNIKLTDAKKKDVKFEFASEGEAVLLKFQKTKSYRFQLTVPVEYDGVADTLTWQFEPQSN